MNRPIGMREMGLVFEVVDELGLSREAIVVPLAPAGTGSVEKQADGRIRITLPAEREVEAWLEELRHALEELT